MKSISLFFASGVALALMMPEVLPMRDLLLVLVALVSLVCVLRKGRVVKVAVMAAFLVLGMMRVDISEEITARTSKPYVSGSFNGNPIRDRLCHSYVDLGLSGDELSIVTAMSLGEKSSLTPELKQAYSRTGASHVLALSGMHLSIIYFLLSWIFMRLMLWLYVVPELIWEKLPANRFSLWLVRHQGNEDVMRMASHILILIIIWCYVMLVGGSPSVVRSAFMLTVYSMARGLHRHTDIMSVLAVTLFVMLLVSPASLVDVGFQMSFLAVLGISLYMPLFARVGKGWLWSCTTLSVAAQIMVLPLTAFYFGRISVVGVALSAWLSLFAMIIVVMSLVVLLMALLGLTVVGSLLASALSAVVHCQNTVLTFLSALSWVAFEGVQLTLPQLLLVYVSLFAFSAAIFKILGKNNRFA